MIAKAAPVHTLPSSPTGWVYEICKRPAANLEACPPGSSAPNPYGGTLLHLKQGDLLRIHFVNQLPPVLDSDHATDPGREFLELNPTNLHTHGMLVSPHKPSASNPTYGDNVFVLTFNSLNGKPTVSPHMHSDIRYDFTDYEIKIPASHPSGLFWFFTLNGQVYPTIPIQSGGGEIWRIYKRVRQCSVCSESLESKPRPQHDLSSSGARRRKRKPYAGHV